MNVDREVVAVLGDLRSAYAALLSAAPGQVSRAVDVERSFGLDKKLAWQVYRVATDGEALGVGQRVPGPTAARRLIRAAKRAGICELVVGRVQETTRAFHQLVAEHAEDRAAFDLMLSAATGDGIDVINHDLKRQAFRVNSQLYGVMADAQLFTLLLMPGSTEDTFHMCSIRGPIGLKRLRPSARLEVARHRFDRTDGTVLPRTPIDPTEGDEHGVALLEAFCSTPIPSIRSAEHPDGFVRSSIISNQLGLRSAVTCVLADVTRDETMSVNPAISVRPGVGHIHEVAIPCRALVHDLLIHPDLGGEELSQLRVIANRRDAGVWPANDPAVLLSVQESVQHIGRGPAAVSTPLIPRYGEMIRHVTSRLGWDFHDCHIHRARIDFPVLDSVVWMRYEIPR